MGDTWEEDLTTEEGTLKVRGKVIGEEEVVVPAGKFKATRIQITVDEDGEEVLNSTCWYAANIGVVKQAMDIGDATMVMELESHQLVR